MKQNILPYKFIVIIGLLAIPFSYNACSRGFKVAHYSGLDSVASSSTSASSTLPTTMASCQGTPAISGMTLYKRMNTREYLNSVKDLFGKTNITVAGYPTDYYSSQGFDSDDASIRITPAEAETLVTIGQSVANQVLADAASPMNACNKITAAASYRACIENLLKTTARKAFRRPISIAEVTPLVDMAVATPGIDGISDALASILASPRFLFHVIDYSANRNGDLHTLNQYEFASRLSFMLWSSIPDDELLSLADANQLMTPAVATAQVQRLLASTKASEFMKSFPSQWLNYRTVESAQRDLTTTPEFTATLKQAMKKEGELLFTDLVRSNLPIDNLVTANYSFVNRELAQFYGLSFPNTTAEYAKVNLDTSMRRGILTQAGVMTSSSVGNTTSPIKRGVFILNRVVCEGLGAPPPGVPKLDAIDPTLPLKERMAIHRTNQSCAACHSHIDPVGLAYENFNSIGKWRTTVSNYAVDAAGTTSDGYNFATAADLGVWIGQGDKFESCLALHLSSYSLGREVKGEEVCNVAKAVNAAKTADGNMTVEKLIETLVNSDFFRMSKVSQ